MKIFSEIESRASTAAQTVEDYLKNVLSASGESYSSKTIFGQIITVLQSMYQNSLSYLEDGLTEQNKTTAQRKSSVIHLADLTGYKYFPGNSAQGKVKIVFRPANDNVKPVSIAEGVNITNTTNKLNYVFFPDNNHIMDIFSGKNTEISGTIYEGRYQTQSKISSGGEFAEIDFAISGDIDEDLLKVTIDGNEYTQYSSFYSMPPLAYGYVLHYTSNGIGLVFGNNIHGLQVYDGDTVECSVLLHNGTTGNVESGVQPEFKFADTLCDITGESISANDVFHIVLTSEGITGGSSAETMASVRNNIGYNSRSNLLIDTNSIKQELSKNEAISYADAQFSDDTNKIDIRVFKNFTSEMVTWTDYFTLAENQFLFTVNQKNSIKTGLENSGRLIAGTEISVSDVSLSKYCLYIWSNYSNSYSTEIKTVVAQFFSTIKDTDLILLSAITAEIRNVLPDDAEVHIQLISKKLEDYKTANPNITENYGVGLDSWGNIICADNEYPVLFGNWTTSDGQEIVKPIILINQ